jgi:hypothetical protein
VVSAQREQSTGNLPLEINTMVGRRQEADDLRRLTTSHRLVR